MSKLFAEPHKPEEAIKRPLAIPDNNLIQIPKQLLIILIFLGYIAIANLLSLGNLLIIYFEAQSSYGGQARELYGWWSLNSYYIKEIIISVVNIFFSVFLLWGMYKGKSWLKSFATFWYAAMLAILIYRIYPALLADRNNLMDLTGGYGFSAGIIVGLVIVLIIYTWIFYNLVKKGE